MEITVRRTGGLAGVNEQVGPVDTAEVDARLADQIETTLRDVDFFELPLAFPPTSGPDVFEFAATVVDGDRSHSTSWDDLSDRPPELDELVELLLRSGAPWEPVASTDPQLNPLFQTWTHSREEDTHDVAVYRPDGFAFPPSFGRHGFQIRPGGTFVGRDIGPNDGTLETPGRWKADVVTASFDDPTLEPSTFTLVSYDQERLRLRRRSTDRPSPTGKGDAVHSCLLLDFDTAEILVLEGDPPHYVLAVSGTKPYFNMEVRLAPVVYVRQPDHWGIEVIGCAAGLVLPAEAPFSVTLPLAGAMGTEGIEVVGASRAQRLSVPSDAAPQLACGDWSAFLDLQPPGPPILRVRGSCTFATAGYTATLNRHEPQGFNPRDLLLDLTVTGPSGPAAQVITEVEVRYQEEVIRGGFDSVTILPNGTSVPVQEVH